MLHHNKFNKQITTFLNKTIFAGFQTTKNAKPKNFKCEICSQTFDACHKLYYHCMKQHNPSKNVCEFCSKCFDTKNGLKAHIRRRKVHRCEIIECQKTFCSSYSLSKHLEFCHSSVGGDSLNSVINKRDNKDALVENKKDKDITALHNSNNNLCGICNIQFSTKGNLNQHMKNLHKTRQCKLCHKTFFSFITLSQHLKNCHSSGGGDSLSVVVNKREIKNAPLENIRDKDIIAIKNNNNNNSIPIENSEDIYAFPTENDNRDKNLNVRDNSKHTSITLLKKGSKNNSVSAVVERSGKIINNLKNNREINLNAVNKTCDSNVQTVKNVKDINDDHLKNNVGKDIIALEGNINLISTGNDGNFNLTHTESKMDTNPVTTKSSVDNKLVSVDDSTHNSLVPTENLPANNIIGIESSKCSNIFSVKYSVDDNHISIKNKEDNHPISVEIKKDNSIPTEDSGNITNTNSLGTENGSSINHIPFEIFRDKILMAEDDKSTKNIIPQLNSNSNTTCKLNAFI